MRDTYGGAFQKSFPGPCTVALLAPISVTEMKTANSPSS
jgi:hypothetical protein